MTEHPYLSPEAVVFILETEAAILNDSLDVDSETVPGIHFSSIDSVFDTLL